MAENLKSIVLKRSENSSFGFSLLGIPGHGHGHVIYDIIENSSAAESGEVEAGDVIVKVNGTDVHRFTTKEVLKCLRLSGDPVTLELKRDPKIKAHVRKFLASSSNPHSDINYSNPSSPTSGRPHSPAASIYNTNSGISNIGRPGGHRVSSSDPQCRPSRIPTIANKNQQSWSAPQSPHGVNKVRQSQIPTANGTNLQQQPQQPPSQQQQQQQPNRARFEAYMMTGDLILNLSRTPQSSGLITPHAKKVDSLRDSPIRNNKRKNGALTAPHAKYDSSPSSPSLSSDDNNSVESAHSIKKSIKDNSTNINNSDNLNLHNINNNNNNNNINNSNNNNMNSDIVMNDKNSRLSGGCVNFSSSSSSSNSSSKASTTSSSPNSSTSNNTFSSHSLTTNNDKSQQNQLHQHQEEHQLQQHAESSSKQMNNGDSGKYVAGGSVVNAADEQPPQHQQQPSDDNGGDDGNDAAGVIADDGDSKIINSKSRSSSSSTTVKSEINNSSPEISYSVPTSPISLTTPILESAALGKRKELPNSVPASPESAGTQEFIRRSNSNNNHHQQLMQQNNSSNNGGGGGSSIGSGSIVRKCDASGFRTSRSEDHLQQTQRDGIGAIVPIDIDEDVNSSLNTLLDTRHDSEDSQSSDQDRIVWTYNAPVIPSSGAITSPISHSSSISSSPQRSDSPASPTSVSSSVMSSSGSKGASNGNGMMGANGGMSGGQNLMCPLNGGGGGDQSVSEAISNISSPDYQDEHDLLSSKDLASMALSDPSDSDSTILVSEARKSSSKSSEHQQQQLQRDHKIVIQVKGVENLSQNQGYSELRNSEDELATITEDLPATVLGLDSVRESSPPVSDDGSDVDSLHSFHYSPKAVDIPSAVRLAKRLYSLDGFKKSDVSRHLSKNNDFSRVVADEYLKYFLFERLSLDEALRLFLKQFSLSGETQERERVLVHFSKRYLDCNPGSFNSQDAVHTLTCAIMLLNTDLHGQNIGRKMTCSEFIDNLSELNDGENFPKDVLKQLYQAIKSHHLEWALDDESPVDTQKSINKNENSLQGPPVGPNPFLEIPQNIAAIEYKKGYVMRKCCYESNFKKTPFGKRSWKMFYCTLRDLVLYLHKDEHGFRKNQMSDNVHNAIRIHHALATKASDYNKKQHVFRLQTSDQSEYLFQTSDSKELQSWIDTINFVCASFSAPPLEGGVGSQKRFQRPLLPCSHTKLLYREQLASHEEQVTKLEATLTEHKRGTLPTKGQALQNYRDKEAYLQYELKRYKTYVYLLSSRMAGTDNFNELQNSFGGYEEENMDDTNIMLKNRQQKLPSLNLSNTTYNSAGANPIIQQQPTSHHHHHHQTTSNRYSYRAAIYRTEAQQDLG